jgi:hypothetical protein
MTKPFYPEIIADAKGVNVEAQQDLAPNEPTDALESPQRDSVEPNKSEPIFTPSAPKYVSVRMRTYEWHMLLGALEHLMRFSNIEQTQNVYLYKEIAKQLGADITFKDPRLNPSVAKEELELEPKKRTSRWAAWVEGVHKRVKK